MTFQETTGTSFAAVPPASAASAGMTMNHFQQQQLHHHQQQQFMLPPQQQQLLLQHQLQYLQEQQQEQYHHHHHHSVLMPMPTQQSQTTTMVQRMPSLPNVAAVGSNSGSIMASASLPVVVGRDQKKPKDEDDFNGDEEHNPNHQTHLPLKKRRIGMAMDSSTVTTTTKTRSSAAEEEAAKLTTATELPLSALSDDERIAALALLSAHEFNNDNNNNDCQESSCPRMTPPPCEPNRQDQPNHQRQHQKSTPPISINSIVPETFSEAAEQTAAHDEQVGDVPYYNYHSYNDDPFSNKDTTAAKTTTTDVALVTPETLPKKRIREKVISVHPLLEDPYYSLPSTMSSVSLLPSSSSLTSSSTPLATVLTIPNGNTLMDHKKEKILKVKRQQRGSLRTAWPDYPMDSSSNNNGSSIIRPSGWNKSTVTAAAAPSKTMSFPKNNNNSNSKNRVMSATSAAAVAASRQPQPQKLPKRLNVPLPGGCHGVTSRNGGYCRRGPRFNGSLYCKLHYHHFIRTGSPTIGNNQQTMTKTTNHDDEHDELALHVKVSESSSDQETEQHSFSMIGRRGSGLGHQCYDVGTALRFQEEEQKEKNSNVNGPMFLPPPPPSVQTKNKPKRRRAVKPLDRHYTGSPGEIQCTAVTTRGKKCKYVSVCGTSYCRLHANHDTNPSVPRRRVVNHEEENDDETSSLSLSSSSSSLKDFNTDFNTATKSVVATTSRKKTNPKRTTTTTTTTAKSKIVVGDSFNHIPSLHSLSTDRWYNQRVMIATGPFQNQIGHVERWSNGWVSVRLFESSSKPVVHNRRSFELLLCPDHHRHSAME